jgi:5-formyltetrahydrofolate cyclo-ligase
MGDTYDQDKRLIRRRLRASRSQLSPGEVARLSARACARLLASPIFARARHLAAYAAADNELDPALLLEAALAAGKSVYLPVTSRERFDFVAVPAVRPGQQAGLPPGGPCLPPGADDVVFLVPGVAFDARGVRLGRGIGWYDRALGGHPCGTRIGLAYEFQVVPSLPEAPWDVRMHGIVTEAGMIGAALAIMKENRP